MSGAVYVSNLPSSSFSFLKLSKVYFIVSFRIFWWDLCCGLKLDLDREMITIDGAIGSVTVKNGCSSCLGRYNVVQLEISLE